LASIQVAESLRQAGHEVRLFDAMLAEGVQDYESRLQRDRPQLALFYEDNFSFSNKMFLGEMRMAACQMIANAHQAGARVIAAGADAAAAPEAYLAAGAEVVLIGEGLATLSTLVARLDARPDLPGAELTAGLSDIAACIDGKVSIVKFRALPPSPHEPARAAWDLIDVECYRSFWQATHSFFGLNIAASRGCSLRRDRGAKPTWGDRYLQRPAEEVAAEMTFVKRRFKPDHMWFTDDIFAFRVDWVADFAAAVHAIGGSVPFTIQTRAVLVTGAMARALKYADCREVWLAVENGSQRLLEAAQEHATAVNIPAARTRLAAQNIRVGFFIQLGFLGEELADILATRALLDSAQPEDIEVDVMFEGAYAPEFYCAVHELMHDQVCIENLHRRRREVDYRRERRSLVRRWTRLISNERHYRMRPSAAAAAAVN
jgi:anaerobic magnesium-protoporphyrin IX monomethyl ester cyclase